IPQLHEIKLKISRIENFMEMYIRATGCLRTVAPNSFRVAARRGAAENAVGQRRFARTRIARVPAATNGQEGLAELEWPLGYCDHGKGRRGAKLVFTADFSSVSGGISAVRGDEVGE